MPDAVKPFIATGAVVFPVFFLAQFFANQFGFDRDGFRALMLSPADRRLILLGKNLAALPVGAAFGVLLIALTTLRLHLPPLTVLATLFQLASVLLMAGVAGNLLSILVPYRIQPGSMKPTKLPGLAMLVLMFCQMLFPVAMLPVFVGAAAGIALATVGLAGLRAGQSHWLRAALRPDGACLLADARPAGPPAPTARNQNPRRHHGGSGIKPSLKIFRKFS